MDKRYTRLKFFRRALRVALCYAFALHAFFAAYSIALASIQSGETTTAALIICHNVDTGAPADSDTRTPAIVPCALCAIVAAASGLLPDSMVTVIAPVTVVARLADADIAVILNPPSARANPARAPPRFA